MMTFSLALIPLWLGASERVYASFGSASLVWALAEGHVIKPIHYKTHLGVELGIWLPKPIAPALLTQSLAQHGHPGSKGENKEVVLLEVDHTFSYHKIGVDCLFHYSNFYNISYLLKMTVALKLAQFL